ncbi:MAG: hypothetical protein GY910_16295 [bacterium]|nr:hypothetical protein [Deltaproteobacteria bacterium]MCP4906535.1 hypothetical protein [bacterium]
MSDEFSAIPLITFKTLKNTELGAESITLEEDGSIVLTGVLKKVTESMLQSYPRTQLGKWTPNRAGLRYTPEEASTRDFKRLDNGDSLDLEAALAL